MAKTQTAAGAPSVPRFIAVGIAPTDEQVAIQTSRARHVIAMANAGAAKTTTLALRIAESITRGVWPESIVALTFSAEAARVLQARLVEIAAGRAPADLVIRGGIWVNVHTRELIEGQGHRVIYGDTDSTFVWLKRAHDEDKAAEIGRSLVAFVNQWWADELQKSGLTSALELASLKLH